MTRGYEFGINYWFRLKNVRIEFLPEITYATASSDQLFSRLEAMSHERQSYNFNFNMQLYPLDFYGDCDCPTFSKDGNIVSKGFYWLLSPGISRHTLTTQFRPQSSKNTTEATMTSIRIGIGAGVDVGVTNLITMSPFLMYSLNFSNNWSEQLDAYSIDEPADPDNSSSINQWHFGVRLVFRPDYKTGF